MPNSTLPNEALPSEALPSSVLPTSADVTDAASRLQGYTVTTPVEHSAELSKLAGRPVWLKLESLQHTGSFKPRISLNVLLSLPTAEREAGVVASTAGGHGIGLAYAAAQVGAPATIFLPRTADPFKIRIIQRYGASIELYDSIVEARTAAQERAKQTGATFVSAYNDPRVIAGGGTVGVEIRDQVPDLGCVIVGMGGGGIAAGIGLALEDHPATVWGVQPEQSAVLIRWLRAGRVVDGPHAPSIAEGLGANIEDTSITFPLAQRLLGRAVTVNDDAIAAAMRWLAEEHQHLVEPSGAAPIAALLDNVEHLPKGDVVLVVTGRVINLERWLSLIERGRPVA